MTWKRFVLLQRLITVTFAVWFVVELVLLATGAWEGPTVVIVISIVLAGVLGIGSMRLTLQAQRHVLVSDREPVDFKDLVARLNTALAPRRHDGDIAAVAEVDPSAPPVARALGTLEVLRAHRNADSLANYQIWIDGRIAGEVGDDSATSLEVEAGIHTVLVRIAWCRSRLHTVEIAPSARTTMVCHSSANRLNVLFLGTLGYRRYLSLSAARRIPE
jgi:hypothetical protein